MKTTNHQNDATLLHVTPTVGTSRRKMWRAEANEKIERNKQKKSRDQTVNVAGGINKEPAKTQRKLCEHQMLNAIFSTVPLCQVEASSQSQGSSLVKHSYPSFGQSAPCLVFSPVEKLLTEQKKDATQ